MYLAITSDCRFPSILEADFFFLSSKNFVIFSFFLRYTTFEGFISYSVFMGLARPKSVFFPPNVSYFFFIVTVRHSFEGLLSYLYFGALLTGLNRLLYMVLFTTGVYFSIDSCFKTIEFKGEGVSDYLSFISL